MQRPLLLPGRQQKETCTPLDGLCLLNFQQAAIGGEAKAISLAINFLHRQVVLDKYKSEDGCYSCGYGAVYSHDDIQETLGGRRPLAQVSCSTMAHRAEHHADPSMTLRQLQHEDHDYVPLACLYTVYSWFTQTQILAKSAKVQSQWACRYDNQKNQQMYCQDAGHGQRLVVSP